MVSRKPLTQHTRKHVEHLRQYLGQVQVPSLSDRASKQMTTERNIFKAAFAKLESATVQDVLVLHHQAQQLANKHQLKHKRYSYTKFITCN